MDYWSWQPAPLLPELCRFSSQLTQWSPCRAFLLLSCVISDTLLVMCAFPVLTPTRATCFTPVNGGVSRRSQSQSPADLILRPHMSVFPTSAVPMDRGYALRATFTHLRVNGEDGPWPRPQIPQPYDNPPIFRSLL